MKKCYLFMFIVVMMLMTMMGCKTDKNEEVTTAMLASEDQGQENDFHADEDEREQLSIMDNADEWSKTLLMSGELEVDLNGDKRADNIKITYVDKEGSQYIKEFKVMLTGQDSPFIIENYDASFEKMELFDFGKDNVEELVIMFDTHGAGGKGTHDIYVMRLDSGKASKINSAVEPLVDIESFWNIDDIYDIEKVKYDGEEKMIVRQYVWGTDGHADAIGDIVSIVSFNQEINSFIADSSWMEEAE